MNEDRIDALLSALAHPDRRRMLDLIKVAPGMGVKALESHFDVSRVMVLKHVRVLEEAELLLTKKEGRTRHLYFNPVPLQLLVDRWTTDFSAFWSERLVDIKTRVERRAADAEDHKSA